MVGLLRRALLLCAPLILGCASAVNAPPDLLEPPDLSHAVVHDMNVSTPVDLAKTVAPPDLDLPPPHALFVATPDLVGFPTGLDGRSSSDSRGRALTFAWSVTAAPSCSHLSADPFIAPGAPPTPSPSPDPSGTQVQFFPDCGGTYSITLTVSTPDHESGSVTQPVIVPTAPLFLYRGHEDYTTSTTEIDVVRSDGTGLHAVSCPATQPFGFTSPRSTESNEPLVNLSALGSLGLRVWEPPATAAAGTPARVVFLEQAPVGDSSTLATYKLSVSDEHGDCESEPPVRVEDMTSFTNVPKVWARFSPSGNRLAFIDADHWSGQAGQEWRLETVNLDGSQRRVVHTVTSNYAPRAAPVWIDETHISWVESSAYETDNIIYQAPDTAGAGDGAMRTTLLDCSMPTPSPLLTQITQYALVPSGVIVAATNSNAAGVGIFKMGSICSTSIPLLTAVHDQVADFDLSPDATKLLVASSFGSDAGSTPPRDIYVVATSGAGSPVKVGGDPRYDDFGPRFIAGGRQIAWTQLTAGLPDAAVKCGGIMVANADGTRAHSLISQDGEPTVTNEVVGGGNAGWFNCSTNGPLGQRGGFADIAVLLIALVGVILRRRTAT